MGLIIRLEKAPGALPGAFFSDRVNVFIILSGRSRCNQ